MSELPAWLTRDPWFPLAAPIHTTPTEARRGRQFLLDVVAQFRVTAAPRYARKPEVRAPDGTVTQRATTYCNIFVWDVTSALGCEVAHWVDAATRARLAPFGHGNVELDANALAAWLAVHGPANGWTIINEASAIMLVEDGRPVVAAWINPVGDGHVGIGVPALVPSARLHLAQAGGRNFENEPIEHGFGDKPFKLYTHP